MPQLIAFFKTRLALKIFVSVAIPLFFGLAAWTLFTGSSLAFSAFIFLVTSGLILFLVMRLVNRPMRELMRATRAIAKGNYLVEPNIAQEDEIGRLAEAIGRMSREIHANQNELNRQRDEYQQLFETVPCIITVQDRDFRLLSYNREFEDNFEPGADDFCYHAYKGRKEKCPDCPVEKTFKDGLSHQSEEMGQNKDGSERHWLVRTAPIADKDGKVVAAMEMSLDISGMKQLQDKLEKTEQKYYAIFNSIPNPVFVLDKNTLEVLDVNDAVKSVYGYTKPEMLGKSFLDLFEEEEKNRARRYIQTVPVINRVRQVTKNGRSLFADVRISPSQFPQKNVILVTTLDITQRLEAEQQLIQAGKMATLGEMATGVAHELNQPLTVIKSASSFIARKVKSGDVLDEEILGDMAAEIDGHVDRASKIINHMREFGRKSGIAQTVVDLNDIILRAHEFFSRQLALRNIGVEFSLDENLPHIKGDPGRLEQVFINLFINARDAIDERLPGKVRSTDYERKIVLSSHFDGRMVTASVEDTGSGIPEHIKDRIFEPFFTTKKVGEGTGLGLSITYGIVKDSGGNITAGKSSLGGASFVMTFPAADLDD